MLAEAQRLEESRVGLTGLGRNRTCWPGKLGGAGNEGPLKVSGHESVTVPIYLAHFLCADEDKGHN